MTEQTTYVLNARALLTGNVVPIYESPLVVSGTMQSATEIPRLELIRLEGAGGEHVHRSELRWELNTGEALAPLDEAERERLWEMARRGEIKPGRGGMPEGFWDMPAPEDPEGLVRQAVREDRDSGL
jgi:hypothetical protein